MPNCIGAIRLGLPQTICFPSPHRPPYLDDNEQSSPLGNKKADSKDRRLLNTLGGCIDISRCSRCRYRCRCWIRAQARGGLWTSKISDSSMNSRPSADPATHQQPLLFPHCTVSFCLWHPALDKCFAAGTMQHQGKQRRCGTASGAQQTDGLSSASLGLLRPLIGFFPPKPSVPAVISRGKRRGDAFLLPACTCSAFSPRRERAAERGCG